MISEQSPPTSWYRLSEVAAKLGFKVWTLRRWCIQGKVPNEVSFGGQYRIPAAWVEERIAKSREVLERDGSIRE